MTRGPIDLVDVFAIGPFSGNPAAVCVLGEQPRVDWLQDLAAELALPATVFVLDHELRWFSPTSELDLCGHGTLAAAYVLWARGAAAERLEFATRGGALSVSRDGDWIAADFPALPPEPARAPAGL